MGHSDLTAVCTYVCGYDKSETNNAISLYRPMKIAQTSLTLSIVQTKLRSSWDLEIFTTIQTVSMEVYVRGMYVRLTITTKRMHIGTLE